MKKGNQKKFKFVNIINWALLFSMPIMLLTVNVKTKTLKSTVQTKNLSTSLFSKVEEEQIKEESSDEEEKNVEEVENNTVSIATKNNVVKKETPVVEEKKEEVVDSTPVVEEKSDVLATYSGKMSFYNANCTGCSGITSTGVDVSDGRVTYQDGQYGNVRIIAAGTEIKKWSIVRIKNSALGNNVLAIVLDRGGSIGTGKKFLIDMLTNSNEHYDGTNNVVVEVLRNGK